MRERVPWILSGLALLASAAFAQTLQPAPAPAQAQPAEAPAPTAAQENQAAADSDAGASPYTRHYTPGEVSTYELRVRNSDLGSELIGVTEHRVFLRGGVPTEKIRWIRLSESRVGEINEKALEVPAYEMSLHPRGELSLIDVKGDPVMLEMVTDLYAFYFAVSPAAGIANLRRAGDGYVRPELVANDWADGNQFLVGQSLTQVRLGLTSVTPKEVVYESNLLPPVDAVLNMQRPWMKIPVCGDTPNNLQFVRRQDDGFLAAWGCEKTQVTSRVDPATGKLLAAFMNNEMTWSLKLCSDQALENCEDRPQVMRHRLIELRLRPPPAEQLPPERIRVNPKNGLEYVWIPPGSFEMGCVPSDADCYAEERPAHAVTLTRGFWMSRTEVPVYAYEQFTAETGGAMPDEPGSGAMHGYNDGWAKKNHPMVKVTWSEAAAFCRWSGGRLPTEAEWEYAARGGVDGLKYPWGNDRSHDQANYWRTGGQDHWKYTAPIGSFPPNAFGLHDMAGNVYEWVGDWFSEDYYRASPAADPAGPASGRLRVARGGAGFLNPAMLRISTRLRSAPDTRNVTVGVRCAADGKL
jgi:formylglycine-generating enzyme required for sulfatase activity